MGWQVLVANANLRMNLIWGRHETCLLNNSWILRIKLSILCLNLLGSILDMRRWYMMLIFREKSLNSFILFLN